jgi:hypothetical protein
MKNIKVNRKKLHSLYMQEVNRIADLFEDKSHFTPEELIDIVSSVIEANADIVQEEKYKI